MVFKFHLKFIENSLNQFKKSSSEKLNSQLEGEEELKINGYLYNYTYNNGKLIKLLKDGKEIDLSFSKDADNIFKETYFKTLVKNKLEETKPVYIFEKRFMIFKNIDKDDTKLKQMINSYYEKRIDYIKDFEFFEEDDIYVFTRENVYKTMKDKLKTIFEYFIHYIIFYNDDKVLFLNNGNEIKSYNLNYNDPEYTTDEFIKYYKENKNKKFLGEFFNKVETEENLIFEM